MSIQYSGLTIINTTFTTTTGTRQEIVNGIATQLIAAGWTRVLGSVGGADQTFLSATTPQGYAIRVRLFEPGSGNCAQMFLANASGSVTQASNPAFLLPQAGGTWRFIGSGYQFFVFVPGVPASTARNYAAAGVPYVPSFLSPVAVGWLQGHGQNDTDAAYRGCFRTSLCLAGNQYATSGSACGNLLGSVLWSDNGGISRTGHQSLWLLVCGFINNTIYQSPYRFGDSSIPISDALISWGATSPSDEGLIRGQLWDTCIIGDAFTADTPATFDSHNWFCITHNNTGASSTQNSLRGSLFVVVP